MHKLLSGLFLFSLASISYAQPSSTLRDTARKNSQLKTPPKPQDFSKLPLLQQPYWKHFTQSLAYYQNLYPGVYAAPEYIRWDELSAAELAILVQNHGYNWQVKSMGRSTMEQNARSEELVRVSREANEDLRKLMSAVQQKKPQALLKGSTKEYLNSLPESQRLALTPIDDTFLKSELGQKIDQKLRTKSSAEISGFRMSPDKRLMILEMGTGEKMNFEFRPSNKGSEMEEVRVTDSQGNNLLPQIPYERALYSGKLMNTKSQSPLPMGVFPKGQSRWVDERGATHYSGDGHKH